MVADPSAVLLAPCGAGNRVAVLTLGALCFHGEDGRDVGAAAENEASSCSVDDVPDDEDTVAASAPPPPPPPPVPPPRDQ
jgi:hypothetical protein